jgi:hypothetical protein
MQQPALLSLKRQQHSPPPVLHPTSQQYKRVTVLLPQQPVTPPISQPCSRLLLAPPCVTVALCDSVSALEASLASLSLDREAHLQLARAASRHATHMASLQARVSTEVAALQEQLRMALAESVQARRDVQVIAQEKEEQSVVVARLRQQVAVMESVSASGSCGFCASGSCAFGAVALVDLMWWLHSTTLCTV